MPLLEPDWSDEERELLESAELDAPEPNAHQRTLAALGIGGAALSSAIATGSAKAAGVAAAPTAAISGVAASGGKAIAWVKLLGLVVAVGAASSAVLHYRAVEPQQANVTPAQSAPPTLATTPATPAPLEPAPSATTSPPTATPVGAPPSASKTFSAASAAHAEPDITLEIEALDRARRASEHRDFGGALRELDSYDHNFKHGRLRPEALLLRVQTLLNAGDTAGAKALGTRFLAKYPKSPLSPRIQKLIGSAK